MAEGSTSPGHATRSVETARCVLTYAQVAPLPGAQTTSEQSGEQLLSELLTERREQWNGRRKYVEPAPPETNALPRLPDSWVWVSPEQIAAPEDHSLAIGPFGSNLKVSDYSDAGVPLVFVRNIRTERFNEDGTVYVSATKAADLKPHQVAGGDILVTKMGAPPGDACLYPETAPPAVITADCIKLRLAPRLIEKRFFVYAINSPVVRAQILSITSGVAQQKVSLDRFRSIGLPLPPLHEQRRIVVEIEKQFTRLDAGVAALRRTQANLKRYRAAVLKAACEGRLVPTEAELQKSEVRNQKSKSVPSVSSVVKDSGFETGEQLLARILAERRKNWQGRGNYKEPAAPDTTNLPPLPEGWTWASVEQLATLVQYGSSAKTSEDSAGVPVMRMGNIQDGKFDFEKLKYLPKKHDEFPELILEIGDLLFNRTNSAELVGKTAVFKGTPQPCSFASYLIRVRFADGCVPDFFSFFINSVFGRAWIADVVSQQVGQANVNGTKLQALAVPLPPLSEQTRIVSEVERRLSVVDELEALVRANLQRAIRLRQAILQKAFSGELA